MSDPRSVLQVNLRMQIGSGIRPILLQMKVCGFVVTRYGSRYQEFRSRRFVMTGRGNRRFCS